MNNISLEGAIILTTLVTTFANWLIYGRKRQKTTEKKDLTSILKTELESLQLALNVFSTATNNLTNQITQLQREKISLHEISVKLAKENKSYHEENAQFKKTIEDLTKKVAGLERLIKNLYEKYGIPNPNGNDKEAG